jgi:uncharacterized membrane protein YfcA
LLDSVFSVDGRIVIAIAAVLLCGFAKGVSGIGLPVIGVPILVALYGDLRAVLLVTIISTTLSDVPFVVQGARYWREALFLVSFVIAGFVGVVLGTHVLVSVRPQILTFVLACVLTGFILIQWLGVMPRVERKTAARWGWLMGFLGGALQGSTGSSGPFTTSYLVSMELPRTLFLFSLNTLFLILDCTLLVSLHRLGLYTSRLYEVAGMVLAVTVVGMVAGFATGRRINDFVFRRGVLVVLTVAVLSLLYRSLRG